MNIYIKRCKLLLAALLLTCCNIAEAQKAGDVITVKREEADKYFRQTEIPDEVFKRMLGKSYPRGCSVKRTDLRYLRLLHVNKEGKTQVGEMVCNKAISADLIEIFSYLYHAGYPIERMVLIDDYGANDERSMEANNTTCFCYRLMTGSKNRVSKHGMGMAVDLNPKDNPYVKSGTIKPKGAKLPPAIDKSSLPYQLFIGKGFSGGGNWKTIKDYQHFER